MWWVSQCSNSTQCRTIGLVPKLSNCSPNGLWTRVSFQLRFRNEYIDEPGATQTGQFVVDCEVHQSVTQAPNLPPKNLWVFVQNQMITKPIWEEICWPYGASFRCHIFCIFEHLFWQLRGVWCQNLQHFLKIYECHMVYMPLFGPLLHRGPF